MKTRSMEWKRTLALAAVLCLALFALPSPSQAAPAKARIANTAEEPSSYHWWDRPKVVQMLKLTEDQVQGIRDATKDDIRKSGDLRKTLKGERDVLYRFLAAEQLDEKQIALQSEKVLTTFLMVLRIEADIQLKAAKVLTGEQRRELLDLRELSQERGRKRPLNRRDRRPPLGEDDWEE